MSDSTPEQNGGGDNLRERYLPVSRKELRRRREAELASQREAQEEADAAADQLDAPAGAAEAAAEPELEASVEAQVPGVPADAGEDELARTLDDVESVEDPTAGDALSGQENEAEAVSDEVPAEEPASPEPEHPEDPEPTQEFQPGDYVTAPVQQVPHDADWPVEQQAEVGPNYSGPDFGAPTSAGQDAGHGVAGEAPEAPLPDPVEPEQERPEEQVADAFGEQPEDLGDIDDVPSVEGPEADQPEQHSVDYPQAGTGEVAPVPASRRARRLLRETSTIPRLDQEMLEELDQLTSEIKLNDDPNNVNPDLLKRQQALAAKAMQANQERLRRESLEREAQEADDRRRRRLQRPESEVIASKTVRDAMESEEDYVDLPSGSIEPVEARGAHGLDIDKLVDETSKEANRPNLLLWLVIVLALLLIVAVAVVLYTVVL
ncbi:hypothetical protein [Nesterenkonia populi]|uniref:hypothetical protein n=1 Tax=Nesterenkonia populi TaxID=1591087 RepID=UPI0011BDCCBB|nr:hypothetical protein [Nesterenkonia populi]